ncbi:hypothetical protein BASA81_015121 [Batrachochytrium salamandrivorans]|nr:hypothetical protein BASA81_015121 [Batrachochytrium salamandrivorans]
MQFSGSQITRLSTVHGRRHSSIDHFVCNAPARALFTSPRVDRQTAVADHFVIRTSIEQRLKDNLLLLVLQPYPAITVSKQPIELPHPITGCLADGASDNTDTDHRHPPTDISVLGISKCSR